MNCVFCNIAKGFAPATIVLEDEEFVAFNDLFPKADTHVLVIPRAHHENFDEWVAGEGSGDRMLAFVGRVASEAGVAGNYRLITNVGRDAGQVMFHMHWHIMSGDLSAF